MIKKILKVLGMVTLVFCLTIITIRLNSLDETIGTVISSLSSQIEALNDRYNEVIANEITLAGIVQDNARDLTSITTILEENKIDVTKMINSDVFVEGLMGMGGGTVIAKTEKSMYILTCYHVISDIDMLNKAGLPYKATIGYSKKDDSGTIAGMVAYGAVIVKVDEKNDLALLKTGAIDDNLVVAPISTVYPQKGDVVYSVGSPLGLLRTISKGILSGHEDGFYLSDNTTTFGNSGGGLYNTKGELIGVPSNVMGYSVAEKKFIPQLFNTQNDEEPAGKFVPETSLGLSIDLPRIQTFLKGVI